MQRYIKLFEAAKSTYYGIAPIKDAPPTELKKGYEFGLAVEKVSKTKVDAPKGSFSYSTELYPDEIFKTELLPLSDDTYGIRNQVKRKVKVLEVN